MDWDNKAQVLTRVSQFSKYTFLQYASERLKDDYNIVLQAVKQRGASLQFASARLKDSYGIVLMAVRRNRYAFCYASDRLQYDYDFVLEAVKQNYRVIQIVSERLKYDLDFLKQLQYELFPCSMTQMHSCMNIFGAGKLI